MSDSATRTNPYAPPAVPVDTDAPTDYVRLLLCALLVLIGLGILAVVPLQVYITLPQFAQGFAGPQRVIGILLTSFAGGMWILSGIWCLHGRWQLWFICMLTGTVFLTFGLNFFGHMHLGA